MSFADYIGQTLDSKYKIERELGRGGMGTVYLANHIGTERHVAVKIIAPQFMERLEFVERFRREARAAGRLRHPNVVNVTDFGFAESQSGRVAYLVMEYLDGCTLGEILDEEQQLPLAWSLDILEQVCSAVNAAHEQGIIHRDLKPDNIWLEPNQRGGYTVKVLDFGIAKLEEHIGHESAESIHISLMPTTPDGAGRATVADLPLNRTIGDGRADTNFAEAATLAQTIEKGTLISGADKGTLIQPFADPAEKSTLIQPVAEIAEDRTALFPENPVTTENTSDSRVKSLLGNIEKKTGGRDRTDFSETPPTEELTRVGAVLGTPLFMSPEQCRGEKLTARSDIYSLGVIAYRMLSGRLPFDGDHTQVMQAHKEFLPPPIESKKIPRKVKKVVFSSLAKNPVDRPPTAEAFAAEMRSQSEGTGALLRRAMMIYSEHLPKFLSLAILFYAPIALFTFLQVALNFLFLGNALGKWTVSLLSGLLSISSGVFGIFCGYLLFGTTTWLVLQVLAVPLRPVRLRPALEATRRKWKTFAGTGTMTTVLTSIGLFLCVFPGLVMWVCWGLVASVVMMENARGFAALRRSKQLIMRSLGTTMATIFIMFFVPLLLSVAIAFLARSVAKTITFDDMTPAIISRQSAEANDDNADQAKSVKAKDDRDFDIDFNGKKIHIGDTDNEPDNMSKRITATIQEALTQILLLPITILVGSFSSILMALLYLKTRQVGGEPMQDLLTQFEETEQPRTKWQERVRQRLIESGRITSKS